MKKLREGQKCVLLFFAHEKMEGKVCYFAGGCEKKIKKWKRNFFLLDRITTNFGRAKTCPIIDEQLFRPSTHCRWMAIQLQSQCRRSQYETNTHDDDVNDKRCSRCRKNGGKKGAKLTFAWDIICRHWDWKCVSSSWWVRKVKQQQQCEQVMWKKKWKLTRKQKIVVWAVCVVSFECGTAVNGGKVAGKGWRKLKKVIERDERVVRMRI